MKYVLQRGIRPCKGDYYARNNYVTSKLSEAVIYNTKSLASDHLFWCEREMHVHKSEAIIVPVTDKELFKARLYNT